MYGNVRFMHCVTATEGDIRQISDVPSDCHVKYGLHSVVKTVWMLFADAVLIEIRATMPAHIASPYFDLIIRHLDKLPLQEMVHLWRVQHSKWLFATMSQIMGSKPRPYYRQDEGPYEYEQNDANGECESGQGLD